MPTSYTSVLKLALPATGELAGTWGDVVNNNITQMVEQAITGLATINTWTAASHTLTTANGTTSESRCAILECSGAPGAAATVICPAATKLYILKNSVTGGYAVTLKTASGTGISVPNGRTALLYCDGTNVVVGVDYAASLALGTPLTVANGGTGLTAPGTAGNVLTSNGTGWVSSTPVTGASLSANNTWTGTQTFAGTSSVLASVLVNAAETTTVSATAATGTINFDVTTQSVLYYTASASANWTVNVRASSGTTLNAALATGQSVTFAFLVTQGATAYYNNAFTVDSTPVTPKWQGGTAPTAGNASGIDCYTYTVIKTGSAAFTVLASLTQYK